MWQLRNNTPFAARTGFFRDHRDGIFWALWIKAGFRLRPDRLPLFLPDGVALHDGPVFLPDAPDVLLADSDLTPAKERIDLILRATAPPPAQSPVQQIRFRLGDWHKTLHLVADGDGAAPDGVEPSGSEAAPVALDGRAAFGGGDHPENPLGRGFGTSDGAGPVLFHPGDEDRRPRHHPRAVTIGPVARHWPARHALSGSWDEAWRQTRAPCLPVDFNPAFWQSAPPDQQLPRPLAPGTMFEAGGITGTGPADAPSRFPLAAPELSCAARIAGIWQSAQPQLQTIHIDMTVMLLGMTWLAVWPVTSPDADVAIGLTTLGLSGADGFRVRADDAHLFPTPASEVTA